MAKKPKKLDEESKQKLLEMINGLDESLKDYSEKANEERETKKWNKLKYSIVRSIRYDDNSISKSQKNKMDYGRSSNRRRRK